MSELQALREKLDTLQRRRGAMYPPGTPFREWSNNAEYCRLLAEIIDVKGDITLQEIAEKDKK